MLLDRKRIGAVLRGFSNKPEAVPATVANLIKAARAIQAISINGKGFDCVDIVLPMDDQFGDNDCGHTLQPLLHAIPDDLKGFVHVDPVQQGDIFVGLLNGAIMRQTRHRIDFTFIISHGVADYVTNENVSAMVDAFENEALVTGIAIAELTESIMHGRIANTFAAWDNAALGTVGLFDARARKPRKDDKLVHHMRSWDKNKEGETFYHLAGVEEIIPLVRMVELYGPCIAPILPGSNNKQWVRPDPVKDPEGFEREMKKMGTKSERQAAFAAMVGADLSFLKGGVMPNYRHADYF